MPENDASRDCLIAVSCPGGMARQFRVQVTSSESPLRWMLAGSFRQWREAQDCVVRLQSTGQRARIVDCRTLPTAA